MRDKAGLRKDKKLDGGVTQTNKSRAEKRMGKCNYTNNRMRGGALTEKCNKAHMFK